MKKRAAESLEERRARAARILAGLRTLYPDAACALHHHDAFELLVATILSAQSTDTTVNAVTPKLFDRFPGSRALSLATTAEVERIIHATGFFRQKAKHIVGCAKEIETRFGGTVPARMEDLVTLPGVARKTANVVLGTWYARNDGFVVDTHVGRLADRLGLAWTHKDSKDAVHIEQDLMRIIPETEWTFMGHALIWHGRRVCGAKRPHCAECLLAPHCPAAYQWGR